MLPIFSDTQAHQYTGIILTFCTEFLHYVYNTLHRFLLWIPINFIDNLFARTTNVTMQQTCMFIFVIILQFLFLYCSSLYTTYFSVDFFSETYMIKEDNVIQDTACRIQYKEYGLKTCRQTGITVPSFCGISRRKRDRRNSMGAKEIYSHIFLSRLLRKQSVFLNSNIQYRA